jgi:hypothetical protein
MSDTVTLEAMLRRASKEAEDTVTRHLGSRN